MFHEEYIPAEYEGERVPCYWVYYDARPYEITIIFRGDEGEEICWVFARDLLREALDTGAAGQGDVRIWVFSHNSTYLRLMSPDGDCTFRFQTQPLMRFVADIYTDVPAHVEMAELSDDDIARYLLK